MALCALGPDPRSARASVIDEQVQTRRVASETQTEVAYGGKVCKVNHLGMSADIGRLRVNAGDNSAEAIDISINQDDIASTGCELAREVLTHPHLRPP